MRRDELTGVRERCDEWRRLRRQSMMKDFSSWEKQRDLGEHLLSNDLPSLLGILERIAEQRPDLLA